MVMCLLQSVLATQHLFNTPDDIVNLMLFSNCSHKFMPTYMPITVFRRNQVDLVNQNCETVEGCQIAHCFVLVGGECFPQLLSLLIVLMASRSLLDNTKESSFEKLQSCPCSHSKWFNRMSIVGRLFAIIVALFVLIICLLSHLTFPKTGCRCSFSALCCLPVSH